MREEVITPPLLPPTLGGRETRRLPQRRGADQPPTPAVRWVCLQGQEDWVGTQMLSGRPIPAYCLTLPLQLRMSASPGTFQDICYHSVSFLFAAQFSAKSASHTSLFACLAHVLSASLQEGGLNVRHGPPQCASFSLAMLVGCDA